MNKEPALLKRDNRIAAKLHLRLFDSRSLRDLMRAVDKLKEKNVDMLVYHNPRFEGWHCSFGYWRSMELSQDSPQYINMDISFSTVGRGVGDSMKKAIANALASYFGID